MGPRFYSTLTNAPYAPLWNKYRPMIIQLMVASEKGPQQYKLYDHEFKSLNPKERSFPFSFVGFKGKSINNIKTSMAAQDLLATLNTSKKATELMAERHFEFTLDRQFNLHVSLHQVVAKEEIPLVTVPES